MTYRKWVTIEWVGDTFGKGEGYFLRTTWNYRPDICPVIDDTPENRQMLYNRVMLYSEV